MIDKRRYEIFTVIVICLILYALSVYFDLAEILFGLSHRFEYLQVDEFFIFLLIAGCGIGYLGMRQMKALRREVAERKRIEAALKESEQYATALFKTMQTGMVVIDRQSRCILDVNPAAREMIGVAREKIIGRKCHNYICPNSRGECPIADQGQIIDRSERILLKADGTQMPVLKSVIATTLRGSLCLIETFTDLTERKALEEQLKELSLTDDLTGISNRRGFMQLAEKQILLAERIKCELYLIFADIDNMKWINDTLGHDMGDEAICDVAQLICCSLRRTDLVGCGRLGGDEFAMLLTSVTMVQGEHPVLERIKAKQRELNARPDRRYQLEISFGSARFDPENPCTLEQLVAEADQKMYECKRSRKEKNNGS
ncbi:MAG: sensor domain-containing diguanylate cyclase [Proteobacteria bacterium]|nr:sensor domain-containing diguanylate cyclase [Pseudomonadota bacterium]MBU0966238.1 sensor domain-containing diguanylate cyclase [Pseudomonadota bacterium]